MKINSMVTERECRVIRPILFNTEMVEGILEYRKLNTRRIVKPQPKKDMKYKLGYCVDGNKRDIGKFGFGSHECGGHVLYAKPPALVGDILWVRETWSEWTDGYVYKAWTSSFPQPGKFTDKIMKWYPSIYMPKKAARIFLRVTDVRVEHLNDMTLDDFLAEGVVLRPEAFNDPENAYMQGKELFIHIWDSTIKKEQHDLYGWDANPWVWVIEFERCKKPEGWCV